ncbi:hypothetical protein SAMN05428985_102532 [Nocardioides sp. YR527]|nr:hypothetical protein SAMN05428985_102532 [Nocardioides sp. YR527]
MEGSDGSLGGSTKDSLVHSGRIALSQYADREMHALDAAATR